MGTFSGIPESMPLSMPRLEGCRRDGGLPGSTERDGGCVNADVIEVVAGSDSIYH